MAIARFLDRMCLALRASGLWLRYAMLQNLIPSFPWIAPNVIQGKEGIKFCHLATLARKEGMLFEETLTGFKWMANSAHRFERDEGKTVLLCYEEAIGFMCGTRDSIQCCRDILALA